MLNTLSCQELTRLQYTAFPGESPDDKQTQTVSRNHINTLILPTSPDNTLDVYKVIWVLTVIGNAKPGADENVEGEEY
jgi:hypothetical protein